MADLSRLTSGFSIGHGRGIFDTHGISGDGGAIMGDNGGPEIMPSATLCMSLSHLSHRFMLTGGFSVSGVDSGLPGGRLFVSGSINADVATVLVSTLSPTLTSFVGIFIFTSPIVMVPLLLWSAFVV